MVTAVLVIRSGQGLSLYHQTRRRVFVEGVLGGMLAFGMEFVEEQVRGPTYLSTGSKAKSRRQGSVNELAHFSASDWSLTRTQNQRDVPKLPALIHF